MSALLPMLRLLLALATIPLAAIAVLPLVERLGRPAEERGMLSLLGGLVWLTLFTGAIWLGGAPVASHWLSLPLLGVLALPARHSLRRLLAVRSARAALSTWGAFLLWSLLCQVCLRQCGGGTFEWDWAEHYQRARFFLDRPPLDTLIGGYAVPARPPAMNLLLAHLLAISGKSFAAYQVGSVVLNSLVALPLMLFLRRLAPPRPGALARRRRVLLALLVLAPALTHNMVFLWTKQLCAAFVLAGAFYLHVTLRSVQSESKRGLTAVAALTFLLTTFGLLIHYSAGPWGLAFGVAYLAFARPWRRPREGPVILVSCALLALTWFAPALALWGKATLASNSTVADTGKLGATENAVKIVKNLGFTLAPHVLTGHFLARHPTQSALSWWRDVWLMATVPNLFLAVGGIHGLLVPWLLLRRRLPALDRRLILTLTPLLVVVGVAVHGALVVYGVGHICLQPLTLLALALVAACWSELGRRLRALAVAALALDFAVGTLLHLTLLSTEFTFLRMGQWAPGALPMADPAGVRYYLGGAYGPVALRNAKVKTVCGYEFLADHAPALTTPALVLVGLVGLLALARLGRSGAGRDAAAT